MRFLSLCSGIEAASVAWTPLGWEAVAFAEIEPFSCAVLTRHYPDVPNLGDISKIDGKIFRGAVDLIVGGTPCQDFSIAGCRAGLDGERSGLAREFIRILSEVHPEWFVWENVPGVLSTNGGRDFRAIIEAFTGCGYGLAWRALDARFFGVPQRRRRVFVVGHLGDDWRPAAKVLFEREGVCRDFTARGKARKDLAAAPQGGAGSGGREMSGACLSFAQNQLGEVRTSEVAGTLNRNGNASGRCAPLLAYAPPIVEQAMSCKWAKGSSGPAGDEHHNLVAHSDLLVRRLTPRECERLMGLPDDYTLIDYKGKPAADGPRYKALGNSMAIPVMRWLGERIEEAALAHGLPNENNKKG